MIKNIALIIVIYTLSCAILPTFQQTTDSRRCFQFTWLGPRYNNESVFLNATCQDAIRLADGVPCMEPLVVSYDGSWPDVNYIWENHAQQASCVLGDNDVCAQYTYSFDGIVENSTYMCTRAVDTRGAAITRGCYENRNGSFATKVCFCRSIAGAIPCNYATRPTTVFSTMFIVCIMFILVFNKNVL